MGSPIQASFFVTRRSAFNRNYVRCQIDDQTANDASYRWKIENGSNQELKVYARETLPKTDDHTARIMAMPSPAQAKEYQSPGTSPGVRKEAVLF